MEYASLLSLSHREHLGGGRTGRQGPHDNKPHEEAKLCVASVAGEPRNSGSKKIREKSIDKSLRWVLVRVP